jgi:antitoxin component of MazEF toxin-antitoxin module
VRRQIVPAGKSSIAVILPSQLAEAMGFRKGGTVEIGPGADGSLVISKADGEEHK